MTTTPELDAARSERRQRVRSAAVLARRYFPGAVGEVLAAELNSWDTVGCLLLDLPATSTILRLVEHLEAMTGTHVVPEATAVAA